jgi:monoamine oxidase
MSELTAGLKAEIAQGQRPRVVIVGGGFAGIHAAQRPGQICPWM